jgi:hypothetical protein
MSRSHRRALLFREPILVGMGAGIKLRIRLGAMGYAVPGMCVDGYVVRLWLVTGPISGVRP